VGRHDGKKAEEKPKWAQAAVERGEDAGLLRELSKIFEKE
jgi:hypothetical protein